MKYFDDLNLQGIECDTVLYNTVISALNHSMQLTKAYSLLEETA